MNKYGFQLLFAVGFGAILTGIVWILISPDSLLPQYLKPSATVHNAVALIHIVPIILGFLLSGNPHGGDDTIVEIATFIQWSLVGFFLVFIWRLFRRAIPRKEKLQPRSQRNDRQGNETGLGFYSSD